MESKQVSLIGSMYDFSVYYNAIDKSRILNIHKYLMVNNYKVMLKLIKQVFIGLLGLINQ